MAVSDFQKQMHFEVDTEFENQIIQESLQANHAHHFAAAALQRAPEAVLPNWGTDEIHGIAMQQQQPNDLTYLNSTTFESLNSSYTASDFLNFLQLPGCNIPAVPPTSAMAFSSNGVNNIASPGFPNSVDFYREVSENIGANSAPTVLFDPIHLSFPPNPPLLGDFFQSLPHTYQHPNSRTGSFHFGIDYEKEIVSRSVNAEGGGFGKQTVVDFRREMCGVGKGEGRGSHGHFATEKQRRESLCERFNALKSLVPNPTKTDRASIVGDAIDYIKELLRTIDELKLLVDKKRREEGRSKRQKLGEDHHDRQDAAALDTDFRTTQEPPFEDAVGSAVKTDREQTLHGSLRSSWLQRTSRDGTWVDVRIVDDEVTIKLIQKKKKRNCLLLVSRILDDLHLQILHANGAHLSDHYVFLFNTKIYEGSCIYASAIANKLSEDVDSQNSKFYAGF